MIAVIWYRDKIDEVIENVVSIKSARYGKVEIRSMDDGLEVIDIISLDKDTRMEVQND